MNMSPVIQENAINIVNLSHTMHFSKNYGSSFSDGILQQLFLVQVYVDMARVAK